MGKKKETAETEKKAVKAKVKVAAAPKKAPAAKKTVVKKAAAAVKKVTPEERQKMVEQAAYFRAERHGFQVDPNENWLAAEAEVDAILAGKK